MQRCIKKHFKTQLPSNAIQHPGRVQICNHNVKILILAINDKTKNPLFKFANDWVLSLMLRVRCLISRICVAMGAAREGPNLNLVSAKLKLGPSPFEMFLATPKG